MKTLTIDRAELVKAIAQLTHVETNQAEWPWMVVFDPTEERPAAEVRLPEQVNTQGGFPTLRKDDPEQPEMAAGYPEPKTAAPLDFSTLDRRFRWGEGMAGREIDWENRQIRGVTGRIEHSLKDQIIVDGQVYRVEYY